MNKLPFLIGTLLAVPAFAELRVGEQYGNYTVTKIEECVMGSQPIAMLPYSINEYGSDPLMASWSCDTKFVVEAGLATSAITFYGIGYGSTFVNPAVGAVFNGAGLAVTVVEFGVHLIPCEEDPKKRAEEFCKMLRAQGYECDPDKAEFEE